MELKDQVCSKELSDTLNKLGVEKNSQFWWTNFTGKWELCVFNEFEATVYFMSTDEIISVEVILEAEEKDKALSHYPAYTVAELGETMKGNPFWDVEFYQATWWGYTWLKNDKGERAGVGTKESFDTEANARAKMLIYLIENKLIPAS